VKYSLVLKGGRLFDPGAGIDRKGDLAISEGKIAALEDEISGDDADRVVEVGGQYVMPGLVDLHTHVYYGVSPFGLDPDPVMARSGTTTWVDAGSAGSSNFDGLRRFIMDTARTRIIPFINLSCLGIPSYNNAGEMERRWDLHGVDLIRTVEANRDLIAGIKLRIFWDTSINTLFYGKQLASSLGLPIMVHFSDTEIPIGEVLLGLGPGDILTHCFIGYGGGLLGPDGHIRPEVRSAMDRGVILDLGHGGGSFSIDVARVAVKEGVLPTVISTDLHTLSIDCAVIDLPTTMSKFLALGVSLEDVVTRATTAPARILGRQGELGTIQVGAAADVAVMTLQEGDFDFIDANAVPFKGNLLLSNAVTILGGEVMSA
jgi:dihydroorotase